MDRGFIVPVPSTVWCGQVEVRGSRDHGITDALKHDRETSACDRSSRSGSIALAIDLVPNRTVTKRRALELVSVGETKRGARM